MYGGAPQDPKHVKVSEKFRNCVPELPGRWYYDVDNMNTNKASFGHFQTNEAALWLSIKSAQQDGSD
jgi:hypothetical protein